MTQKTDRISSVGANAAGMGRVSANVLEDTARGIREKSHGDSRKGTGNIANAAMKANENKGYFGNYDPKASYRRG